MVSTIAGGGGGALPGYANGIGSVVRFNGPAGITSWSTGDLLVTENSNHMIRKITTSGKKPSSVIK